MNTKTIAQGGVATVTLDTTNLSWDIGKFFRHQIQVTGMGVGNTVTIGGTPTGGSVSTDIVGSAVSDNDHVVVTPDSGLFTNFVLTFSVAAGTADILISSYDSTTHSPSAQVI